MSRAGGLNSNVLASLKNLVNQVWDQDLTRVIMRGAGVTLAIQVAGSGLAYATHIAAARWLGAAGYGSYSYALAWAVILAIPASMGFQVSVVRFLPEYAGQGNWSHFRGVLLRSWQFTLVGGIAVSVFASVVVWIMGRTFGMQNGEVLLWGVWLVPLQGLVNLQRGMGRGLNRMKLAYAPNQIFRHLFVLTGLFVAAETEMLDAVTAIQVTIAALLVVTIAQGSVIWRSIPEAAAKVKGAFATRRWLGTSLPLLLIAGFVLLLNRTDVVMLGLLKDAADVGIYYAASRTASFVGFVLLAINAISGPMISSLYSQGEHRQLQRLASLVAHLIFWPSLVICIVVVGFADSILRLFGEGFVLAGGVLAVLAGGQLANAGAGSVGYFMNMTGHEREAACVFGSVAVLNLILNALLIPPFGPMGAATATAAAMVSWNVALNVLVRNRLGIRTSIVAAVADLSRRLVAKG